MAATTLTGTTISFVLQHKSLNGASSDTLTGVDPGQKRVEEAGWSVNSSSQRDTKTAMTGRVALRDREKRVTRAAAAGTSQKRLPAGLRPVAKTKARKNQPVNEGR